MAPWHRYARLEVKLTWVMRHEREELGWAGRGTSPKGRRPYRCEVPVSARGIQPYGPAGAVLYDPIGKACDEGSE